MNGKRIVITLLAAIVALPILAQEPPAAIDKKAEAKTAAACCEAKTKTVAVTACCQEEKKTAAACCEAKTKTVAVTACCQEEKKIAQAAATGCCDNAATTVAKTTGTPDCCKDAAIALVKKAATPKCCLEEGAATAAECTSACQNEQVTVLADSLILEIAGKAAQEEKKDAKLHKAHAVVEIVEIVENGDIRRRIERVGGTSGHKIEIHGAATAMPNECAGCETCCACCTSKTRSSTRTIFALPNPARATSHDGTVNIEVFINGKKIDMGDNDTRRHESNVQVLRVNRTKSLPARKNKKAPAKKSTETSIAKWVGGGVATPLIVRRPESNADTADKSELKKLRAELKKLQRDLRKLEKALDRKGGEKQRRD